MTQDASLLDQLIDRLAADNVPDDVIDLVLAAYVGDEALDGVLDGRPVELPARDPTVRARPQPLYLESVSVAGFRGVGPEQSLRLQPNAGLTLVVGRNGSGKSSYAEAVELALTGDSARWAERNSVFKDGWRNLHHGSPCHIEVHLRADGAGKPIRVRRSWRDDDTEADQGVGSVLTGDGTADLRWQQPLETYRPFLTASDLGRLVTSRPSGLFDALAPILGMTPLTEADGRLMRVRRELSDRIATVKARREALRLALAEADDQRAADAVAILAKRTPDLDALDRLLADAGEDTADPVAVAGRRVVAVEFPELEQVDRVGEELAEASRRADELVAASAGAADEAARLLRMAVAFHDEHGDVACPVCGAGTLDAAWRANAGETVARLQRSTAAVDRLREVRARAERLLDVGPRVRSEDLEALGEPATRFRALLDAWDAKALSAYPPLLDALTELQEHTRAWLRQRHDAWREQGAALQEWLLRARATSKADARLKRVNAARDWLKPAITALRDERFEPFAQHSQEIWDALRQESNVELAGMRLAGANTRRTIAFPAKVDGTVVSGARGTWPRACAWLLRMALESAMDDYWRRCHPGVAGLRARAPQFLVLERYAGRRIAANAGYTWWALSRAGHHHCYELGLTAGELRRLRDRVTELVADLRSAEAGPIAP
ncbi:AAA family ATPase [Dactylosporangium sp. NPDC000244]|uniref:AAA family ATPase n=1 Tax=Dactylosporangium sp. NPDC000244 TaxID=3154365 RepID=UPI003324B1F7